MSDLIGDEEGEESVVAAPIEMAPPRENSLLFGHEAAEMALLDAVAGGRLPHAWLITGSHGIGKATLAFRFARFLLADLPVEAGLFGQPRKSLAIDPGHPVFRRVASGGHPDLLVVERGVDPKRKRMRSDIIVDDTRSIGSFLHLTPADGRWRVVIVDGADLMNRNAANALLKILEEPPKRAILLLLSDNSGRLLPTIRSRCRRLALKPLPTALLADALQRYRPDLSAADSALSIHLADGSIGRALELAAGGGLLLYRAILDMLGRVPGLDGEALHGFADKLTRSGADEAFHLFTELLPAALARLVGLAAAKPGAGLGGLPQEQAMAQRLLSRRGLDQWVEVWEKLTHLFAQSDGVNLDRKQVVLNAFFALEETAR
jgi:DNA polymerase-3 subunit delta'